MKIVEKRSGKAVGEVLANRKITIEEACSLFDLRRLLFDPEWLAKDEYDLSELEVVPDARDEYLWQLRRRGTR